MMKKAMILGTYNDAPYHPFAGVDRALKDLLSPDFDVTLTDDPARLEETERGGYSLLVSYLDAFDKPFPDALAQAVCPFVRDGGGLLCLHNGISLQTNEAMYRLIGGRFLRHPRQTVLRFLPAAEGFLKDLPGFAISEEPYQFELYDKALTPLLRYEYEGASYPGGWCRAEGAGRVVFLTPGHSAEAFRVPEYLDMIARSARWLTEEKPPKGC